MITIEIDSRTIERALKKLSRSAEDMTPIMREIGEHIASKIDLTFRDAKDPYGNAWDALSNVTIARRTNNSRKPLNDSGALKASITSNPSRHSVEIGSNEKYAKTHQSGADQGQYGKNKRGSPIPWGDVPARPFLPTSEQGWPADWETDILAIIRRHLESGLG